MHTFGHPADLEPLLAIAHDYNLILIEDAAESLGSYYQGQHTGTFGRLGILSFNGNKTITTGGGGAILTNDANLAKQAKHITTTAKLPHAWEYIHDQVGYNYRMPNINAALGCAQLEQLPAMLETKHQLFRRYQEALKHIDGLTLMEEPAGCKSNYWLQTLILDEASSEQRNQLLQATNSAGLMTRPVWQLMHKLKPYIDCPKGRLSKAESLEQRIINIPSSSSILCTN
jgi:dTDP-4-amino-4,6-dideoxygalactose transaminase